MSSPRNVSADMAALAAAVEREDFIVRCFELTKEWTDANAGVEVVDHILQFMEARPDVDFGTPGPLVRFVERFEGHGYEAKLCESLERAPTPHTVWMLSRAYNASVLRGDLVWKEYRETLRRARVVTQHAETHRRIDELLAQRG